VPEKNVVEKSRIGEFNTKMATDFRLRLWSCLLLLTTFSFTEAFYIPGTLRSYDGIGVIGG
jgi:hypothetical protein